MLHAAAAHRVSHQEFIIDVGATDFAGTKGSRAHARQNRLDAHQGALNGVDGFVGRVTHVSQATKSPARPFGSKGRIWSWGQWRNR